MANPTLAGDRLSQAQDYQRHTPETTALYRAVQHHLETFLASARDQGRVVPRFVERELRAFLACGVLAHGFLRIRCPECGRERLVAFSCKSRGFWPSCGARRMADTAAHLVDRLLPEVPVRAAWWTCFARRVLRSRRSVSSRKSPSCVASMESTQW